MNFSDTVFVFQWWLMFFIIGIIFLPITDVIFSKFFDKGYIFSKVIGIAFISYIVFLLGILKILPFNLLTIDIVLIVFFAINIFLFVKVPPLQRWNLIKNWKIFLFEEILFLSALFFWSYIRTHQPDIHGLEKYMDFGFINSILRSEYFPPRDMWFTPYSINYYYFGHLVTAVLTKLSVIPSPITFNLMLSTIFAFTFTAGFSIGANLVYFLIFNSKFEIFNQIKMFKILKIKNSFQIENLKFQIIISGLLSGLLLSFGGNLHSIYSFFKPYVNENPVPFWQLVFSPSSFPNSYWYPNATRFIHNTIHEFPIYSSVVSDLHGHYLDVPFVLLTLGMLLSIFLKIENLKLKIPLISFLLAAMYMTNAWDGIIYLILTAIVIFYIQLKSAANFNKLKGIKYYVLSIMQDKKIILHTTYYILLIFVGFFIFSLPFNIHFKPFASGIGILCAPDFLTKIGKLGPFLFEKDHCQHSPLWQLFILYGFFYFWAISFFIFIFNNYKLNHFNFIENFKLKIKNLPASDIFVLILITLSTLLIILPEFIYIKDIYPAHYRANTMFKLVYQSFVMLSLCSGYIILRLVSSIKYYVLSIERKIFYAVYFILATLYLILVFLYPYFAINSYYENLKTYRGLDGTAYLKTLYPSDYQAMQWLNKNIKGQPVILEAQGDSYTDYGRISTNTGLPTVLGWTVHEWLWRGTYDIPSPRIPEVQTIYETSDLSSVKQLINKYHIELVFMGDLERQKYPKLNEEKFKTLGKIIYKNGNTKIYKII